MGRLSSSRTAILGFFFMAFFSSLFSVFCHGCADAVLDNLPPTYDVVLEASRFASCFYYGG